LGVVDAPVPELELVGLVAGLPDPPVAVAKVVAAALELSVPVAEARLPDAEADADGTVFPAALQELAKASKAASAFEPHMLWILAWTLDAESPQIVSKSTRLCWELIAPRRQAGCPATTICAVAAKTARNRADFEANIMVKRNKVDLNWLIKV